MAAAGGWVRADALPPGALFEAQTGEHWCLYQDAYGADAVRLSDGRRSRFAPDAPVRPVDLPALLAERADLLALLEVARRDTDGAELGAAREREEIARRHCTVCNWADGEGNIYRVAPERAPGGEWLHYRRDGSGRHVPCGANIIRSRGPLLPAGPLETEQARGDALAAENAQLKRALNEMVDAYVKVGFGGGPTSLLRRALDLARKALGVGQ